MQKEAEADRFPESPFENVSEVLSFELRDWNRRRRMNLLWMDGRRWTPGEEELSFEETTHLAMYTKTEVQDQEWVLRRECDRTSL